MVRVSIASLIYKSPKMADWIWHSVHEYTPMIGRGEAEFFFVANDPTDEVLAHLRGNGYRYIEQRNPRYSDEELLRMGYAKPEYIHRVYKGYNRAILASRGEIVVLVNSDHYFSPDWLENLLKYFDTRKIVCSQLVEPRHAKYALFGSAVNGEFGNSPRNFNKGGFLEFCMRNKRTGIYLGGAYMPCMLYRDMGIYAGLYPEGNLAGQSFDEVAMTGDEAFFGRLAKNGVLHITALDSLVYHLKEGEKDDEAVLAAEENDAPQKLSGRFNPMPYGRLPSIDTRKYQIVIQPTVDHPNIIAQLLSRRTDRRRYRHPHLTRFQERVAKLIRYGYNLLRRIYFLRLIKRGVKRLAVKR
jgi:Glycosyl transferase family 2